MTNTKLTRRALLSSVLSLVLCFTMLLGTTFAWFTDEAVSSGNKIIAGNLDVQLLLGDGEGNYDDISNSPDPIFGVTDDVDSRTATPNNANTLWEPGKTQVAYLAIKNAGNLDLKYQVVLEAKNEVNNLCDVMQYAITPDAKTLADVGAWTSAQANSVSVGTQIVSVNEEGGTDLTLKKGETHYFALSIHMDENAGNAYKNGEVVFDITVRATQLNSELDSIGPDYDKDAPLVAIVKKTVENTATTSATVNVGGVNKTATVIAENNTVEIHNGSNADDTIADADDATVAVTLPAGVVLEDGATELQLVTKETDAHENVTLTAGNVTVAYEIKVEGVVEATADPIVVTLKEALPKNLTNVKVYHNGVEMGANEFSYDINTGDVTLYVKHFSNFTFSGKAADMTVVPEGAVLVSNAQDLTNALTTAKAGDIVFLMDDITLTKGIQITDQAVLNDITLDGNGHTITANISGRILRFGDTATGKWCTGAKIKNLTIEGSAEYAIWFDGGTSSELTNVTVTGDYNDIYGGVIFYGTHGGTLTDCNFVSGFTNGQSANPLKLVNSTIGSLFANDGAAGSGAKIFLDENSSINTLSVNNNTKMVDTDSLSRIGTFLNVNTENELVAKIGEHRYVSIQSAVDSAEAGDTITVINDVSDETVTVDKSLTITGDKTLNNVSITASGTDVELTVSGLNFTGNSWINANNAKKLTVSGVTADVTPSNGTATNSRSAFIALGSNERSTLELVIENCNIVVPASTDAVLGWAQITKATITGNTIGSEESPIQRSSAGIADAAKFMSIADGATFTITGNTVYTNSNGFAFYQKTTRDNAYTVYVDGNDFHGTGDHIWVEVSGTTTTKATVKATSKNTVNGNTFTAADIKSSSKIAAWTSYAGVDVTTDTNGKLTGGTITAKSNMNLVAEGYTATANTDGTYTVAKAAE